MSIDWGRLKEQGRVKDINKPWTDEELHAIHKLKIPVDLVRKGVLTLEEIVEEGSRTVIDGDIIEEMTKDQLIKLATSLAIEVPKKPKRGQLINLIKGAHNQKAPEENVDLTKVDEELDKILQTDLGAQSNLPDDDQSSLESLDN